MLLNLFTRLQATLLVSCLFFFLPAHASHLVGDEFTYVFIDSSGGYYHYRVTLNLYEDCMGGTPEAIDQDNPAYLTVFNGTSFVRSDSVTFISSVPVITTTTGPCGIGGSSPLCILRKTFEKDYYLAASSSGYTVVYQRCCKNGSLTNLTDPIQQGSTYICNIPPIGLAHYNNSAVFTNYPPEIIGLNDAFTFDNSATDADGDSLSYEFCVPYIGATASDIKPWIASPPPYVSVDYHSPYTYTNPMSCSVALTVDPVTGMLSGTPNVLGKYLIAICCHEWRGGVMINTTRREFEFDVQTISSSSYHPFAGNDTIIYVGDTVQFNASHGSSYLWSPGIYLTSTSIQNPVGHFPSPGVFPYVLTETSDSGCVGSDTVVVTVIEASEMVVPNCFTPNGDGVNDAFLPMSVKHCTLVNFKVYNRKNELLYTGTTANDAWDGTFKGRKQDVGEYFYEVFYLDNNGRLKSRTGTMTLIR